MKKIKHLGALLSFLFLSQFIFAQAGSTFTNPMTVSALPYVVTGDSTCGYGDNYTTADIACTGFYMSGDEKIYSFTPASNIASFNVEMTNISDSYSGIYITDDSTSSGNCMGSVGSGGTATRGVYGVSLVSGTTYYIIVSTWATPQCISSFDINMYTVSCPAPTSLGVSNLTTTTVDFNWTEAGSATLWQYEYDTAGFSQGAGTMDTTSSNPFSVTGLTVNTSYEFYVRSICGAGDSSIWAGPYSYATPCNAFAIPFTEGFETGFTDQAAVAGCLSQESVSGSNNWTANSSLTSYNRAPRTGSFNAYLRYGNEDWIFIPVNLVGGTSYTTDVYARQDGSTTTNADVMIAFGSMGTAAGMTDTIVAPMGIDNSYQLISGAFTPITSGVYYIGIKGYMNFSPWYISIDDISIYVSPACLPASTGVVTNITATTADLGWTENGSATLWEVEYDTTGFAQGSGVIDTTSSNPYSISGLVAQTDYEFYVRAICGPGDTSAWVGPIAATTACNAVTAFPYTENFDGALNNNVWSCWTVNNVDGGSTWSQANTYIAPTHSPLYAAHGMGNNDDYLISPQFTIGSTPIRIKFWDKVESSSYLNTYTVRVSTTGTNPSDFTDSITTINCLNTSWLEHIVDLSAYSNQNIYVALHQTFSGSTFYGFGIDDFTAEIIPTCPAPVLLTAMNLATDSADLAWTESGSATTWQVEWDTAGFTTGNGTVNTTSSNPLTVSGLSSATDYSYYVRAICGPGDTSVWVGPFSFQTTPDFCAGDHFYDDGGALNDYSINMQDTTVICPSTVGDVVKVTFNTFATESGYDDLTIYNGLTTAPSFGTFDGSTAPGPFVSTDASGCLTFVFSSDGSVVDAGWDATIQCLTPMNLAITGTNVSCNGVADGTASIVVTGGTAPFGYVWTNGDTTMLSDSLSGGMNFVTVTDAEGLVSIDSITITEPTMLVATVVVDSNASCFGMSDGGSTVMVSGGTTPYSYAWSTTEITASIAGLSAGTYYITVSDSNNCSANDSVMITEPIAVTVDLGNDTAICNGVSLNLDAGASVNSYLWSDNSTSQTLNVSSATAGIVTYSVLVADAAGCTADDSINIMTYAPVVVGITGSSDLCAYETATLDAGSGFASYTWNTTETSQTILADAAVLGTGTHTYSITVTDTNGCAANETTSFDVFAAVVVDLGKDTSIIWFGSDTIYTLDAGSGFTGYLWSDGTTNQTNDITLANSGNVVVVVTDGNGCLGSDTVLVDFILSVPRFEVGSLKMYPNPADDQVNIELNNFKNIQNVNVKFLSITGEVVLTKKIQVSGNSYRGTFDVSNLATGTYFVQFEANGDVITRQFVIK